MLDQEVGPKAMTKKGETAKELEVVLLGDRHGSDKEPIRGNPTLMLLVERGGTGLRPVYRALKSAKDG